MSHHLYRHYTPTAVSDGRSQDEMPVWHGGDGRSSHANPLFPMYNAPVRTPSGDGQGRRVSGDGQVVRHRVSGDGLGARRASGDGQSGRAQDVVLNVNPIPAPARKGLFSWLPFGAPKAPARGMGPTTGVGPGAEAGTGRTDTWKLVALVFVFFIWIGTASTLLFLYMDQYLFP